MRKAEIIPIKRMLFLIRNKTAVKGSYATLQKTKTELAYKIGQKTFYNGNTIEIEKKDYSSTPSHSFVGISGLNLNQFPLFQCKVCRVSP